MPNRTGLGSILIAGTNSIDLLLHPLKLNKISALRVKVEAVIGAVWKKIANLRGSDLDEIEKFWMMDALVVLSIIAFFSSIPHAATKLFPMPLCRGFKLEEATIVSIQNMLTTFRLTSVDLINCYIDRIEKIDPYLNSIIEINPDVYSIAERLDRERQHGIIRSILHGIPILVKDNLATADRMNTTAGSYALVGSIVADDSHVVALLRKAGAIIMGKANLAEWSCFRDQIYQEGWSNRGGQCRNAYNLTQDPAGSSSGSAQAVTANLITASIGTETDGSIIGPSQRAGLIGIKPSVGLTSRYGVIPISQTQDTVGPLTRTFMDAAHLLNIIRGVDIRDPITLEQKGRVPRDYTKFVSTKSALKNVRIGIPWTKVWESPTTRNQMPQLLSAIKKIRHAGAIIINNTNLPSIEELYPNPPMFNWTYVTPQNKSEFTILCYDFKRDLNRYLSQLKYSPVRSLSDVIKYNVKHEAIKLKYFGHGFLEFCDSNPYTEEDYITTKEYFRRNTQEWGIDAALMKYNVEALLVPSDNCSISSQVAAQAGYPMVTIPAGIDSSGVPFGLGLWGTAYSEHILIKIGSAIDDVLRRRRPPKFLEYPKHLLQ